MSPAVLHVSPYMAAEAGGPPVVVARLAAHAGENGYDAAVLTTPAFTADGGAALARSGPRVTLLPGQRQAWAGAGRRQVANAVNAADIVHLHTTWSPLVASAAGAARAAGVPYVLAPHGMLDPWSMGQKALKKRLYWRFVERRVAEGAARLVYTAASERDLAARITGPLAATVVPLGADAPPAPRAVLAAEFFAEHPGLAGRPLVLFLGRLHAKKQPEALVEALPMLRATHPRAMAVFVGTGPAEADLRARAASAGQGEAVVFLGHREGRAKWQALAAATLFALPSQQENFAIAVAEALRMGLPCLLTPEVAIAGEVVAAGAGRMLDSRAPAESLAREAGALMGDETGLHTAGREAAALAARAFTWESCARATCALYNEILER